MKEDFRKEFLDFFPISSKKIFIPRSYGIMTASSKDHFIGLQMLIHSVTQFYDIITLVYDIGLTKGQKDWLKQKSGVYVKPYNLKACPKHFKYAGAWFKSHYIRSSPFKNTIWLDADTMIRGNLTEIIDLSRPEAIFTSDHTNLKESTLNKPFLYSCLPIDKNYYHDIKPYLNTGVLVVNKKRDEKIIEDWCYCVEQAYKTKEIADSISCWDQGACKWSLHKNNKLYLIIPDKKFNMPARVRQIELSANKESVIKWFESIKEENCTILHWMGNPKPWKNFGEIMNI